MDNNFSTFESKITCLHILPKTKSQTCENLVLKAFFEENAFLGPLWSSVPVITRERIEIATSNLCYLVVASLSRNPIDFELDRTVASVRK